MALFKISKGKSENLPTNKVDGYCYVTTNDHKFYVDYTKDDGTLDRFALNAVYADVAKLLGQNTIGSSIKPIYLNNGLPVACEDFLPLSAGESNKLTGPLGLTKNVNYGTSLPSTGFNGQLFFVESGSIGSDGPSLPTGGTAGQVLIKNSSVDGDAKWSNLPTASASINGIVTTGTQTFAGNKTFNDNVYFGADGNYGYVDSDGIHGAVWNDYAEFRNQFEDIEPGYCVASADNGKVYKTTEKLQPCDGIVSDTFGFSIGKTNECETPLAVAGRVLAYCEGKRNDYHSGDTVCAGKNGLVCKMTREEIKEYPDRIIGIVSEIPNYETWGSGNVPVNGRIWIKVK